MARRLGIAIVFAITVMFAIVPFVLAQTAGSASSGQIGIGTTSGLSSHMGTMGTQYAMGPQGIGFCQAQCKHNDWQCLFDCLRPAGGPATVPGDPPDGPQVNCGPCVNGQQRCWIPGAGARYFPCDQSSCRTPACR